MKLVIMIPCFNEEKTLPVALAALPRQVPGFSSVEFLVIGDGCTDKTIEIARSSGVQHVHDRGHHAGLATTFTEGLALAAKLGADVVVNFDADNQYPADKIPALTAPILAGRADVVIGERSFHRMGPAKRFFQHCASSVASLISGLRISDVTSGFRAYNRVALDRIKVKGTYTYTMETSLNLRHQGLRLATIPVESNPDLRPSRLIRSYREYALQAAKTIVAHLWDRSLPVRRRFPAEWVLAALTFTACSLIATFVFRGIPLAMDEYAFLAQAKMFASGKIYEYRPDLPVQLRDMYFQWVDGKYFSKYAPGWPLFLAGGVLAGVPALVNPLIAAVTIFLIVRLVETFVERKWAIVTGFLVASNPYFWGYACSLYSHSLALLCTVTALYLVRSYEAGSSSRNLILAGLATAFLVVTRPLDGFCLALLLLPLSVRVARQRQRLADAVKAIEAGGLILACLLVYNFLLSGKWSIAAYPAFSGDFVLVPGAPSLGVFATAGRIVQVWFSNLYSRGVNLFTVQYVGFACFGLHALAVAGFLGPGKRLWKTLFVEHLFLLVFLYFFHAGPGWPMYGSRYYYTTIAGLAVLAACGMAWASTARRGGLTSVLFVIFLFQSAFSVDRLFEYNRRFDKVVAVNSEIERQCPDGSIVIVNTRPQPPNWPDFVYLYDFKRNGLRTDRRLLIQNDRDYEAIKGRYPDRPHCRLSIM